MQCDFYFFPPQGEKRTETKFDILAHLPLFLTWPPGPEK